MTLLLHGFWGAPKDWAPLLERIPLGEMVSAPDLYEPGPLSPDHVLHRWTENFLEQLEREAGSEQVQLIGYSMGGRLALNALVRAPERFSRALILSAAPYLPDGNPEERAEWEKQWSRRFLLEDWSTLEEAWQDQPVLSASKRSERRHSQELREMLGLSLMNWSVRHHPFGRTEIKDLPGTVDWAFGALDQKYVNLAKTLQELPVRGQISVIPNAGHRLITDAVDFVRDWVVGG